MSQLVPKRTKFRKMQKGNNRGTAYRGSDVDFGDFGMQAIEPGRLTARQIEAARMAITRHVKRAGKLWIRIFPHRPVTKKPLEVRMGGGKGSVEEWAAAVGADLGRAIGDPRFPKFAALITAPSDGCPRTLDESFDFGLHCVLDGIESYIESATASPARRKGAARSAVRRRR